MNLFNKIKKFAIFILTLFYFRCFVGNKAVILMYHSIGNRKDFFCVNLPEFERQMTYLKENSFNVISLEELVLLLEEKSGDIPPKTVVLTFDDGFDDNYSNAFPILKKYNFPFTVFLQTSTIDRNKIGKSGIKYKMLERKQIKEMLSSGLTDFEPHTVNHPKLSKLNIFNVKREILESKIFLEKEFGKKCDFFAYPFGNYNQNVISALKDAGFRAAVTVEKGVVKKGIDPFRLKRNSIDIKVDFCQFKSVAKFGKF